MKKFSGESVIKYVVAIAVGLLLSYYVMVVNDFANVKDEVVRLRLLADCFTVPGVVLIMVSILCWLSSKGAMDGIAYAIKGLGRLIPGLQKEPEKYYEYVMRKKEKRKGGYGFLAIVGLGFLLVSIVFIVKFYQVY